LTSLPKLQYVFTVVDMIELYDKQIEALFVATHALEKEHGTL